MLNAMVTTQKSTGPGTVQVKPEETELARAQVELARLRETAALERKRAKAEPASE
jgi:hypothetical protein